MPGKKPVVDIRTPRINFMDQGKLCELDARDLVKKGDDDPTNWVFGNLRDVPTAALDEVHGGSSAHMNASPGISSKYAKGSFDASSVSLSRIDGLPKPVCEEIHVFQRRLSVLVAFMVFFHPVMVLMRSLRKRLCPLKLKFLLRFVTTCPPLYQLWTIQAAARCSFQAF
ncbi:hypothetical protein D1007_02806 [Hordeum vulgare]|nr:hypothetical protein D1007_02806 [Hordeum vulgare]